jgi:hypothetical protein
VHFRGITDPCRLPKRSAVPASRESFVHGPQCRLRSVQLPCCDMGLTPLDLRRFDAQLHRQLGLERFLRKNATLWMFRINPSPPAQRSSSRTCRSLGQSLGEFKKARTSVSTHRLKATIPLVGETREDSLQIAGLLLHDHKPPKILAEPATEQPTPPTKFAMRRSIDPKRFLGSH